MEERVHIVVSGLVQGVGFRWFVQRRAQALGLSGFVRNRVDGSVELEAEGERALLESLIGEVRVGPRSAQVMDCRIEWLPARGGERAFLIR
jgi:acylphosphatase